MKKCLKFISLMVLVMILVAGLSACGTAAPQPAAEPAVEIETPAEPESEPEDEAEAEADEAALEADEEAPATADALAPSDVQIALIAHSPDSILDDGSFNEGAWQGIQRFISTHGISGDNARFFQPHAADDVARIDLIADAIGAGANILVLPGFHFESSLYEAQDMFPDTKFVLLDASPRRDGNVRLSDNLAAIHYAEEEAGFLAGYAAVMEGYRNLGFMGGIAVPAVVRFGHGFIQGAEHAAASLELSPGDVTINYNYIGSFAPDPAVATTAASWFAAGTEVIFAAAGGAGFSVMSGAEGAGGSTIGVDVDQAALSPTVITSAVKGLDVSVYDMLTDFLEGHFRGGRELRFDASINGIGLPMHSSRFQNFTQAQYDEIFALLANRTIVVSNIVTPTVAEAGFELSFVTVVEV